MDAHAHTHTLVQLAYNLWMKIAALLWITSRVTGKNKYRQMFPLLPLYSNSHLAHSSSSLGFYFLYCINFHGTQHHSWLPRPLPPPPSSQLLQSGASSSLIGCPHLPLPPTVGLREGASVIACAHPLTWCRGLRVWGDPLPYHSYAVLTFHCLGLGEGGLCLAAIACARPLT